MTFAERIRQIRENVVRHCRPLPSPWPSYCLFFSVSDGTERAIVVHAKGTRFDKVWEHGVQAMLRRMDKRGVSGKWLRVDWVDEVTERSPEAFEALLRKTKRNYFRKGLCFDSDFTCPLTEQEINANAILYGGPVIPHATLNAHNLEIYGKGRFGRALVYDRGKPVFLFSSRGIFADGTGLHPLFGKGLSRGVRQIEKLSADDVFELIRKGSEYLARQIDQDGRFVYGYFPCFDRRIDTYNTLRHASTTYAMTEAWEVTGDPRLKSAIERSLNYITGKPIRFGTAADGSEFAMLVDSGDEIKLGGNAVLILALVKYCEVTGTRHFLPLAEKLARGIRVMQSQATGKFVHILHASDFSVKEENRIIYYEGEAAFALIRLYELTQDERWLEMVEKAFSHFIAAQYWRKHDHWLSYCVNELTRYRPKEEYFRFGVQNFAGYLGFVANRITTFPTLLELMMAAHDMLSRLARQNDLVHLLEDVDIDRFYEALEKRAHHLLNGHFWPELAMYFRNPERIVGSFFIRHHAFRVRIDDVEHYLSGLIAYHHYVATGRARLPAHSRNT